MAESCEEILGRVVEVWRTTRENYRDGMRECGRLAAAYCRGRLAEGVPWMKSVARVAASLKGGAGKRRSLSFVQTMMAASAACDLLVGAGTDLKGCPWTAAIKFAALVKRTDGGEYALDEGAAEDARAVLTMAMEGSMTVRQVEKQAQALRWDGGRGGRGRRPEPEKRYSNRVAERPEKPMTHTLVDMAAQANPRDLADLIQQMLDASPDPEAVLGMLQARPKKFGIDDLRRA